MAPKSPKSPKTTKAKKEKKAPKEKRAASAYNVFMKTEIERLKKSQPNQTAKDRFKAAALNWAKAAENPKNKK